MSSPPGAARAPRRSSLGLFLLTASLAVSGGVVALIGTQVAWERGTIQGREVASEEGSVRFPDEVRSFDADDLRTGSTLIATGLVILVLAPLLAGPRVRAVLYAGAALLGVALITSTRTGAVPEDFVGALEPGPGRSLTLAGAALALASSLVAIGPSSGVRRLGMPERSDDERAPTG